MNTAHWEITSEYGFLSAVAPEKALEQTLAALETTQAEALKHLVDGRIGKKRDYVFALPNLSTSLQELANNPTHLEILFMLYGYAASAWVRGGEHKKVPSNISQTLDWLGRQLGRPPMLSYAGMVLNNWRLRNQTKGFTPQNLDLTLTFTDLIDESWFFRVHIAIEAQAGQILQAMMDVQDAIEEQDNHAVLACLRTMQSGLVQITKTFHDMPKLCDPDIYFQDIRPYLMSFEADVVFEGVSPNPTPLRGGSGAQSSIVPAMLACLGIDHQENQLTANLQDMRQYMPREHREFIQCMQKSQLRQFCAAYAPLRDAYNHVLRNLITFRRAHLYYARTYIFEKSTNPIGTGGTEYMSFLSKLIDETAEQLL